MCATDLEVTCGIRMLHVTWKAFERCYS